jgi:hypothetical protein
MRRRTVGVAISVIVHAGVLAYVALFVLRGARRDEPAPVISAPPRLTLTSAAAEPTMVEVALLDDTPPRAAPAPSPPRSPP